MESDLAIKRSNHGGQETNETLLKVPAEAGYDVERGWDGHICELAGSDGHCDGQTWRTVCLTIWCPCVVFG